MPKPLPSAGVPGAVMWYGGGAHGPPPGETPAQGHVPAAPMNDKRRPCCPTDTGHGDTATGMRTPCTWVHTRLAWVCAHTVHGIPTSSTGVCTHLALVHAPAHVCTRIQYVHTPGASCTHPCACAHTSCTCVCAQAACRCTHVCTHAAGGHTRVPHVVRAREGWAESAALGLEGRLRVCAQMSLRARACTGVRAWGGAVH